MSVVKLRPEQTDVGEIADKANNARGASAMIVLVMDEDGNWAADWSHMDARDLLMAARSLQLEADSNLLEDD